MRPAPVARPRAPRLVAALALATLALRPGALAAQRDAASRDAANTLPTVAVLEFSNGALVRGTDYGPLGKGIAEMLVTELARNPALRVVERDRLQQVLAEQDLGAARRVDAATAAKVGKLVGARHFLTGAFVVDPRENVRLDVRAVNTETGTIDHVETVRGKASAMLELVEQLGRQVNAGLRLPPLPARAEPAAERLPGGASGTTAAKPRGADQFRAMMLLSRALEAEDRKDVAGARQLYRTALDADPSLERARTRLASLERAPR